MNCSQSKKDQVWSKIKLKLQDQKLTLPTGVLAVAVLDDFSAVSSLLIALESDDKSYAELSDYAEELCEELRRLPHLAKASIIGEQDEEIAVILDNERIAGYAIDPAALFADYQSSALAVPAGSFETEYTYSPMKVSNPSSSESQIAEHIIFSDPEGNVIRLKDVATIERRYKNPDSYVNYNGNSCLIINVEMMPDNNIVEFGKEMDTVLDEFMAGMPESVRISRILDQPKVVGDSVFSFLRDLLISMLVVIMVMLLLFPMKSALIAGSGVPICTAISIGIMYMTGIDLNTVTLGALIATLGMIVDNSIITMDGYMGKLGTGLSKNEAADRSVKELFPPTLAATLAICAMFFPAKYLISGYLGDFVKLFPWVFVIALLVSLFYAVTVVPSLEVKFIHSEKSNGNNIISRAQNVFFSGMGGHTMLYLAYLIVQSILMGATIDYGILFTNFYLTSRRQGQSVVDALKKAYGGSIHTIMTSGLIIILAPLIMSELLTDPTICSILSSLTFGALSVILLIILVLPALLAVTDRLIIRKK